VLEAQATPQNDTIAFVDDGSIPFEKMDEGECQVRVQRVSRGGWSKTTAVAAVLG
jgi:hypothetical protein